MAKRKRSRAELELPEAIIQHIQSFLNGKEAAQTTILSKSWYTAWLTRPNLDFVRKHFDWYTYNSPAISFRDFVKKTVDRYEKLNLKIDSLRAWNDMQHDPVNNQLIKKALKMGATDIDLKNFYINYEEFALFGSENLIRLSMAGGGKIGIGADGKVRCSRLKSLTLDRVRVEGYIIRDIISSCPLIENLELSLQNRVSLSPFTKFKLKCLSLSSIDLHTLFFDDFSCKFPCLKDLSVHECGGYKGIQISSPSLECISFTHNKMLRVKFDVPSIRKFEFSGTSIPSLSFKTTSTSNWESDISINCGRTPSATWFLKLNKLLTKLSPSKVSLSLQMRVPKISGCAEDIKGLPKPEVENLTIRSYLPYSICSALFTRLFRCCRPIYVLQHWYDEKFYYRRIQKRPNRHFMEFDYKNVMKKVSCASQRRSGKCDLEGVDVEYFDEAVSAWRPRSLDASTSPGADEHMIRLHLRWGS